MVLVVLILLLCVGVDCQDDESEQQHSITYRCIREQATIMESVLMMQHKMERQEEHMNEMNRKITERQERDMEEIKAEIKDILRNQQESKDSDTMAEILEILRNQQKKEWFVIQRRVDGDVSFDRTWEEYKNGFGDIDGSFWIGLETLYDLTKQKHYVLHVDIKHFNGSSFYANYTYFRVSSESDGYKLDLSGYSGTAGDGLAYHNGMMFSTKDRDNDQATNYHCANKFKSGWWFKRCFTSNLNGIYWEDPSKTKVRWNGTMWQESTSDRPKSLQFAQMKIRPF